MKTSPRFKPLDLVAAGLAAAAAALVFGVVLASLAAPRDFDARVAAIQTKTQETEGLLKPLRDRGPYGPEALCAHEPSEQARRLRELLEAESARGGLAVDSLDVRPEPAAEISERVTPVRLRVSVTGGYESAVALAARLARERPTLFVDSLDLTPKVSNVTLSLSGRVFCGV